MYTCIFIYKLLIDRPVAVDWTIPKDKYEAKMFKTQGDDLQDPEEMNEMKVNGEGKPNKKASKLENSVTNQKNKIKREESSEESEMGVWYFQEFKRNGNKDEHILFRDNNNQR